jgi:hypothetical protein
MNGLMKRLLILAALGCLGALGIYLARQTYVSPPGASSEPPDNYQNGAPPVSAHATPDKKLTPEELKKRLDSLPGAKAGG